MTISGQLQLFLSAAAPVAHAAPETIISTQLVGRPQPALRLVSAEMAHRQPVRHLKEFQGIPWDRGGGTPKSSFVAREAIPFAKQNM